MKDRPKYTEKHFQISDFSRQTEIFDGKTYLFYQSELMITDKCQTMINGRFIPTIFWSKSFPFVPVSNEESKA